MRETKELNAYKSKSKTKQQRQIPETKGLTAYKPKSLIHISNKGKQPTILNEWGVT